jgi:hypothetical protein
MIRTTITLFIIFLIVLPLPPSTMIGMAVVAHPKTNRHLCPVLLSPILRLQRAVGQAIRNLRK